MKKRFKSLLLIKLLNLSIVGYGLESKIMCMCDTQRSRNIPIVIYEGKKINRGLVIISPGYGVQNTEYSFIANALTGKGFLVVSIQHDLETDKPLPRTGDLFKQRKFFWENGVQNILFVINELRKIKPDVDTRKVILIGHSNGGDTSMMFATLYPKIVSKIVSLDSRRYPFPKSKHIDILRFGVSDDEPDNGVVPNSGIQVIYPKGALHNDLCDRGNTHIKVQIQKSIIQFLG